MKNKLFEIGFFLRSIIFPERCAVCNKLCDTRYFCKDCAETLPQPKQNRCTACGLPEKHCNCKNNFYYFHKIVSPFMNEGAAKTALYRLKFMPDVSLAGYFGEQMANTVKENYKSVDFDFVTAVPMPLSSKRKRGFNQAEVLGKKMAKHLGLPYQNALKQKGKHPTQHLAKTFRQRYENVRNQYAVKSRINLISKNILLVDDIKTSGATLSECARLLRLNGAASVCCVTALVTDKQEDNKNDLHNEG